MSESNIFTIYGTDPFLIELKRDEVFLELKKNNFFLREIFFNNDKTFKFESLYLENEASLFSEKKILDLRVYSPITKENTEQFIDFCLKLDQEKSLVLSIYNIDRLTTKKWFKEISKISKVQEVKKVYPNQFRNWVIEQYKKNSLDVNEENISLLVEKTQGNFLAAMQEIKFLKLLNASSNFLMEDSSDFEIFNLSDSIFSSDLENSLKILQNLKNKKTPEPIIIWFLYRELERLILIKEDKNTFFPGPKSYQSNLKKKSDSLKLDFIVELKTELAKLDRDFKLGRSDFWKTSEQVLIKLCNPQFFSKTSA